jgi:TRAP-type C4-dicarboxylate transport system substrate-binding protein
MGHGHQFKLGVLALIGLMLSVSPALAEDRIFELRLSHWLPPSHPLHKSFEEWGSSVEHDSKGTIKFRVYPAQQLGRAFDHYDMARDGIADLTYVSPGYQPGRFPIFDAINLPLTLSNAKAGSGALDDWYRSYAASEMSDVKYCFAFAHDPGSFHSREKKIVVPDDLVGMKIRPAQAAVALLVSSLGATNVQAAAPEVRDALGKGVADAVTFPWGSIVLFGIDKVTKFHLEAPLYTTGFVWVMNPRAYTVMSKSQQQVIDDHCNRRWAERIAGPWADFEHEGIAKLNAQAGHELYTLTGAQLDKWRAASEPVVRTWSIAVRKAGANPEAVLKGLKNSLAESNSGL